MVVIMTRKHYIMLAQWCGQSNVSDFRVENLMELLEEDNPNFDKNKFRKKFLEHRADYETYNRELIVRARLRA
tara:strand:- start:5773 stop:5991 length:219 start_codon:yes stop_codon:yes gene_type:complete